MGKIRSLLGISKPSEPKEADDLPSLSMEIVKLSEAWQGNLPCVHGPSDGCNNHNPGQINIFFDNTLFGHNSNKIKPSGNHKSDQGAEPNHVIPEIRSNLPRTSNILSFLPRVHKSVPWSLSFYHINSAIQNPPTISSTLSCAATTGTNPSLSWSVTPLLVSTPDDTKSLLIAYSVAFTVQVDLGAWSESVQHGRAVAKEMLIGSGYRDFTPCPHTHLAFTSHRGEGKNHKRYAGVSFTRKTLREGSSSKWEEKKEEWRSEVEGEIAPVFCGRCYTDVYAGFTLVGKVTIVSVLVFKDLGEGVHPADPNWLSLLGEGVGLKREEGQGGFGRLKRAFSDVGAGF